MSQAEFAALIGMSRSAYGQVETGAINIGLDAIVQVCSHFNYTLDAIILGSDQKTDNRQLSGTLTVTLDHTGRERIVLIDNKARASYPAYRVEQSFFKPLPSFSLPGEEYQQASYRCFEIDGDSMEKTLHSGDLVVCKYVDIANQNLREGYVYVIVTAEDIIVKRLEVIRDSRLVLLSDNSFYKPIEVNLNEVKEVWFCTKKISGNFTPNKSENSGIIELLGNELSDLKKRIINLENQ